MIYFRKKVGGKSMNKLLTAGVLFGLVVVPAGAASVAAPSHITRDARGGYDVTYSYKDKVKNNWYATARAELNLLNFKNKYSTSEGFIGDADYDEDNYSFEPVFGGSLALGYKIDYFWRAELEAGYLGYFSDDDKYVEFTMSQPYLMAAGYYDFTNGLYLGAGAGAALSRYEFKSSDLFTNFSKSKTTVSPMLGVMLGWTHKLDDNLVLDLRYRLAGMTGAKLSGMHFQTEDKKTGAVEDHMFKSKTDYVLDNSISLGIRYEF